MIQTDPDSLLGLVLAGGEGRRLGGADKGQMDWSGEPMAAHAVTVLRAIVPEVLISANRSLEAYQAFADHVVPDIEGYSGQGPLSGLLAAMNVAKQLGYEALLVSPCDTPAVPLEVFQRLLEAAGPFPARPVLVSIDGRVQPLHGVYPVMLADPLKAWLDQGQRKVLTFAESVLAQAVDCTEFADAFVNRNSPADFPG